MAKATSKTATESASEQLFRYELHDNETDNPNGINEYGFGSEEKCKACVVKRVPLAHFLKQKDGSTLIFRNKEQAVDVEKAIGSITAEG